MDLQASIEGTGQVFRLQADDSIPVRQASPVPSRRVAAKRQIGTFQVGGLRVTAWVEKGMICFRQKYSRKVERISLDETWHHAIGQLEMRLR
jgi:hypothetical protein